MAKLGEADSRWIVDNRTDGKNVDNWHWTEKDLLPWAEDRFKQKFSSINVPSSIADIKVDKVDSVTGSMVVCNRKGKTFYVFDVQLKLEWSGTLKVKEGEESVTGKGSISIENIANDEDKWKSVIKLDNETPQNKSLRDELKNNMGKIDDIITGVLEEMMGSAAIQYQIPEKKNDLKTSESAKPKSQTESVSSGNITTKTFTQKITFEVPPNLIYETLLDPPRVSAFTGGKATIDNKVGSEFSFLDGVIHGNQVELVHPKKIVQNWRFNSWPKDHFSQVTITFEGSGSSTDITLTQKGIPSSDYERTCGGWERFFWQRIRGIFGFNYKIN